MGQLEAKNGHGPTHGPEALKEGGAEEKKIITPDLRHHTSASEITQNLGITFESVKPQNGAIIEDDDIPRHSDA